MLHGRLVEFLFKHFSLEHFAKTLPFKEDDMKNLVEALRDAGMK